MRRSVVLGALALIGNLNKKSGFSSQIISASYKTILTSCHTLFLLIFSQAIYFIHLVFIFNYSFIQVTQFTRYLSHYIPKILYFVCLVFYKSPSLLGIYLIYQKYCIFVCLVFYKPLTIITLNPKMLLVFALCSLSVYFKARSSKGIGIKGRKMALVWHEKAVALVCRRVRYHAHTLFLLIVLT